MIRMNFFMTKSTNWYNKQRFSVVWVMILLCFSFCASIAIKFIWSREATVSNGVVDSIFGFNLFRMLVVVTLCCQQVNIFVILSILFLVFFFLFGSLITYSRNYTLWTSRIKFSARFAMTSITSFLRKLFVKFRNRLDLFATRTGFCYDCFRHFRSFQRDCLEPVIGYAPIVGSFYFTTRKSIVKGKFYAK